MGKMVFRHPNAQENDLQGSIFQADAKLPAHWQTFFQSFNGLGSEVPSRQQDMHRLLRENGVTYNIYDAPMSSSRQWNLDIIPFLIGKEEWEHTEKGLVQRAELLNLILKDIYGERRLIKDGILPMELIYNHTGFLRQCDGMMNRRKQSLVLYSANMARSADGRIWVISDRTQAPSGSGYALENRLAFARTVPELFSGLKVRWLAPYFDALTSALKGISPQRQQNPRVVILTPGPGNETYFEHSYLASYLGFTLVQGNDLMVKDNYLWLKTMGGLERVDVILRRVDDIYCDPLELKDDSQLGVPGLVQAIRSGNVAVANPLGSSILESPGLMPFLQGASRYLLKQDLIMPNIASWWCGQPKELNYVLANISRLVIKKIYRDSSGSSSVDATSLSKQALDELKKQIQAAPYLFVGQEKVNFSSTPSLVNGKVVQRNALFRTFLVSHKGSYLAMKGGLTRTSAEGNDFLISNQLGGMSKDTWILAPEPEQSMASRKELNHSHDKGVLPSHTAENLFWVGRYAERFLGNARFLRTVMQSVSEGNRLQYDNDLQTERSLLEALTHCTFTYPGFLDKEEGVNKINKPWPELRSILLETKRQGSLISNFNLFNRAVYTVRDHWSTDTWRVLRNLEEEWTTASANPAASPIRMLSTLDSVITGIVAFVGLNRESITREQGWLMLDMGRKIEQCLLLISMLRATLVNQKGDQVEYNLQEAVLKSHESLVNYRYKYKAPLQLPLVLDLMLFDPNNPRSVRHQMERLRVYAEELPPTGPRNGLPTHERLVFEVYSLLKLADKEELSKPDKKSGQYKKLDTLLSKMYGLLSSVPVAISKTYFKHAEAQKQLFRAENV